jgi:filamentous hemagglutinin
VAGWPASPPCALPGGVRIDPARATGYPSQRVPHVVVRSNGRVIDRNGNPLPNAKSADAHIPLEEYKTWTRWDHP